MFFSSFIFYVSFLNKQTSSQLRWKKSWKTSVFLLSTLPESSAWMVLSEYRRWSRTSCWEWCRDGPHLGSTIDRFKTSISCQMESPIVLEVKFPKPYLNVTSNRETIHDNLQHGSYRITVRITVKDSIFHTSWQGMIQLNLLDCVKFSLFSRWFIPS